MMAADGARPAFAVGEVIYADGMSAICGDVTAIDTAGVTIRWRATVTVERPEDLTRVEAAHSETNGFARGDIVYADGASAILGAVTTVDHTGITVAWRSTVTVEQPDDLTRVTSSASAEPTEAPRAKKASS